LWPFFFYDLRSHPCRASNEARRAFSFCEVRPSGKPASHLLFLHLGSRGFPPWGYTPVKLPRPYRAALLEGQAKFGAGVDSPLSPRVSPPSFTAMTDTFLCPQDIFGNRHATSPYLREGLVSSFALKSVECKMPPCLKHQASKGKPRSRVGSTASLPLESSFPGPRCRPPPSRDQREDSTFPPFDSSRSSLGLSDKVRRLRPCL